MRKVLGVGVVTMLLAVALVFAPFDEGQAAATASCPSQALLSKIVATQLEILGLEEDVQILSGELSALKSQLREAESQLEMGLTEIESFRDLLGGAVLSSLFGDLVAQSRRVLTVGIGLKAAVASGALAAAGAFILELAVAVAAGVTFDALRLLGKVQAEEAILEDVIRLDGFVVEKQDLLDSVNSFLLGKRLELQLLKNQTQFCQHPECNVSPTIEGSPPDGPSAGTIFGTSGPDVIWGTPRPEVIYGLGGDDLICGFGGGDTIFGGWGNDQLFGGNGSDTIFGGTGKDHIEGGFGADDLQGGGNSDRLEGQGGIDTFVGGPGNDVLVALDGRREVLSGGAGKDRAKRDASDITLSVEIDL